jgi:dTDP-4-amino-4,6-dideoxygalactose transaminase
MPSISEEEISAVVQVLASGWLTTGQECLAFEHELAEHLGAPHVSCLSSCTAAMETVVAYLDLPKGARVGVPTWTFVATGAVPARAGLTPVLLDVDPTTLNLSVEALEADIRDLDLVIGVHFGGVPLDPDVRKLCAAHDVPLIEDAAHAMGTRDDRGLLNGRGSVAACFSFYATKNLTTGEGGALATEDEALDRFSRSYRMHGMSMDAWARYLPGGKPEYDVHELGIKGNLADLLAAVGRVQLRRFDELQARRRRIVTAYRERLTSCGFRMVPDREVRGSADHLVVALLPEGVSRTDVVDQLAAEGVGSSVHFKPLHRFDWFRRNAATGTHGIAAAEALADRALSLPLSPLMERDDVDTAVDALLEAVS